MEEQAEYKVQDSSIKDRVSQSAVERVVTLPAPFYEDSRVTIYHGDCEEIMPHLEDADLLLTDPPYGIGENSKKQRRRGAAGSRFAKALPTDFGENDWDREPPKQSWINEMMLKAKWRIIWGGNYFNVPPSSCWLVWDKDNGTTDFADCELAWTNLPKAVRKIKYLWNGMLQQRMGKDKEVRVHPTQKPLSVMIWAIQQAPDDVATIIDPYMGSGTTLVAAKELGRMAIGIERNLEYCQAAVERLRQETLF